MAPDEATAQRKKQILRQKLLRQSSRVSDGPDQNRIIPKVTIRKGKQDGRTAKDALQRLKSRATQLEGSKFRFLNETLYTTESQKSLHLFQADPDNFRIYHEGFRSQVRKWPQNPVDCFIQCIRRMPSSLVIADFGCGEAKIAESVSNPVHSFDLVAVNDRVTACDIANVPLETCSVDIAVFCLSLMGINWPQFIREANRVLRLRGMLKIAEVRSRICDINAFTKAIESLGFRFQTLDDSNKMFLRFEFIKSKQPPRQTPFEAISVLKPCLYKKR